jgi:hypothetical protein
MEFFCIEIARGAEIFPDMGLCGCRFGHGCGLFSVNNHTHSHGDPAPDCQRLTWRLWLAMQEMPSVTKEKNAAPHGNVKMMTVLCDRVPVAWYAVG